MISNPFVSVLMPCYNSEAFLAEAIESILNQTFSRFEFLIIDDGSSDKTRKIISMYAHKDPRVLPFFYSDNCGIIERLNFGLSISRGRYIARMDSDDICHPERLERQVQYMERNINVGVLSTEIECIDEYGFQKPNWTVSIPSKMYSLALLFRNNICHPSVMFRRRVLNQIQFKYENDFYTAEDYKAWIKLADVTQIHCLEKRLLKQRFHQNNVSVAQKSKQIITATKIINEGLKSFGLNISSDKYYFHSNLITFKKRSIYEVNANSIWLIRLLIANIKVERINSSLMLSFVKYMISGYVKNTKLNFPQTIVLMFWWVGVYLVLSVLYLYSNLKKRKRCPQ
ncbi:MAG: glycosyltransferase family 2 protein [Cyclobacteriaceae bacterium]